ncbi:hypothetical protein Poly21_02490 [Allorhodopirellula heiligendammensis]|uniref:Uncharacterized protein n=1 Tax=Allorhodopirellula heiligendammensis TaxID=2714739 RepID=A0A5C6C460_9BACT|nr:hypothetical protein Poly21_02490 [Allorhodopirellula heiligendammensis]
MLNAIVSSVASEWATYSIGREVVSGDTSMPDKTEEDTLVFVNVNGNGDQKAKAAIGMSINCLGCLTRALR